MPGRKIRQRKEMGKLGRVAVLQGDLGGPAEREPLREDLKEMREPVGNV